MPRLPSPEDLGTVALRPARGVTEITPVQVRPDLATGKVMQDLGAMMIQEAERVDDALALDSLNQLQEKHLELTYGDNGFTKLQGKQVTDRPVIKEYSDQASVFTEGLAAKLNTPKAKQKFLLAAADANRGLHQKLAIHTSGQIEKVEEQAVIGAQVQANKMAAAGDTNGAVNYWAPIMGAAIQRRGLTGDAAATFAQETMGGIYTSAIDGALTAGRSGEAMALLEANKGLMTPKQVEHYEAKVKTKNDYAGGLSLSQEAYSAGLKGRAAAEYIQSKSNGNKELAAAGIVDFEHKAGLDKVAEQELSGAAEKVFIDNGMNARAAQLAQQTPEFSKLSLAEQAKRKEHWVLAARSTLAFGQHQQDRAEAKRLENPEILLQYQTLVDNPQALARYTDGQILSMRPDFGAASVQRLVAFKHQNDSEAKRFQIQKDYVEGMMPEDIRKPKTPGATLKRDQFEVIVKDELMDWKIANPGALPDKDTQVRILEKAKATLGTGARFFGKEVKAYELKPIPQDFASAQNARARQLLKRDLTRDELTAAWARAPGSQI